MDSRNDKNGVIVVQNMLSATALLEITIVQHTKKYYFLGCIQIKDQIKPPKSWFLAKKKSVFACKAFRTNDPYVRRFIHMQIKYNMVCSTYLNTSK